MSAPNQQAAPAPTYQIGDYVRVRGGLKVKGNLYYGTPSAAINADSRYGDQIEEMGSDEILKVLDIDAIPGPRTSTTPVGGNIEFMYRLVHEFGTERERPLYVEAPSTSDVYARVPHVDLQASPAQADINAKHGYAPTQYYTVGAVLTLTKETSVPKVRNGVKHMIEFKRGTPVLICSPPSSKSKLAHNLIQPGRIYYDIKKAVYAPRNDIFWKSVHYVSGAVIEGLD